MIDYQAIKRIHAAKTAAGMTDPEYRGLLRETAGVASCKSLRPDQVAAVVDAILAVHHHRRGWQPEQLRKIRKYARLAKLTDNQLRGIIHQVSGYMHEDSPQLSQYHFDRIMPLLETKVSDAVAAGLAAWPAGYQPQYWRRRNPGQGEMTTRERRLIFELWAQLRQYLLPEQIKPRAKKTSEYWYLQEIAAHACGYYVRDIWEIKSWQALLLIDALRDRIKHATKKAAND